MKKLSIAIAAAGLALATIGSALAVPPGGSGGGYYGSAWYNSSQGSVVGPYASYYECNAALQAAINNAVNNFGWSVTSVSPCHYNPPFAYVQKYEYYELAVVGGDAGDSGDIATGLLSDATKLRETYRIDAYDRAIRQLIEITDPNLDPDADAVRQR